MSRPGYKRPADGDVRGEGTSASIYKPGHALERRSPMQRGWVGVNRYRAYEAREGACQCDATHEALDWPQAVVTADLSVLCTHHHRVMQFGVLYGADEPELRAPLTRLWKSPCRR